ncbi:MAG: hypothetical protein F4Z01_00615 [Gammaproteobacteria bacterium]|nr:hypothetical protein [Gammaproteobacteria bacterium]MYF38998.1 hypothetical protein [Gammaproteobacteria bacterium]
MRLIQIVIITVILLCIVLAIVFLQKQNKPKSTDEEPRNEQDTDVSTRRTAMIFIGVIGISVVALCTTVVVFHMVG